VSQSLSLDAWQDVLTLYDRERIVVRRKPTDDFRKVELLLPGEIEVLRKIGETHYAHGNLYVISTQASGDPIQPSEVSLYIAQLSDMSRQ
jgi:hypothetical protein